MDVCLSLSSFVELQFFCRFKLLLCSRFFNFSTSSCAHLTIIVSSSVSCLCHSSLLPSIPFLPSVLLITSAQVSLGLPRFLLPGGRHFMSFFWQSSLFHSLIMSMHTLYIYIYICIYRVSRGECARLRENVP